MNFLDLVFIPFLIGFLIIYYLTPARFRYIVIFAGSLFFYGYADPRILLVLLAATLISYTGGLVIEKSTRPKPWFILFFTLEILLLVFYKYTNFIISSLNPLFEKLAANRGWPLPQLTPLKLVMPIGLSFIAFQTCGYLSDVYRKGFPAEKNFIRYGAFAAFFPTVLSGPIQKARVLLPQIRNPERFSYENAQKGILLFVWGIIEKVIVANQLMKIANEVLDDYANRSSAAILIGAVCFSLYIYADFSSISDMARGVGKLMGIDVGKNFTNPYLSASVSEFWNRWHRSLNSWLTENIYIPLGGNRKGTARKMLNVMIVFAISGLWHGADWNFLAWGILNGLLVVGGQLLKKPREKLYARMKLRDDMESLLWIRRLIVFIFILFTWMFFRTDIRNAFAICGRLISFEFVSLFDSSLAEIAGTASGTLSAIAAAVFFCAIQYSRRDETGKYAMYKRQPFLIQCLVLAVLIVICVFGMSATEAHVNSQFIYFQF